MISCQTCLFTFDSINYLFTHLDELSTCSLHQSASYSCPLCLFKCTGSGEFCRHLSCDHQIEQHQHGVSSTTDGSCKQNCKCTYCEKIFWKPSDLVRHLRIHTNEKPYKCRECGRSFKLKSTLNGHEKTHREVNDDEVFSCIFCSHNFLSFSALKLHMRIHTNETPFPCDYPDCKQNFRTKKLMHTHFRNFHKNENASTTSPSNLHAMDSALPAPCPQTGVLNMVGSISRLEPHPLVISRNTAFSQFQKPCDYNEEIVFNMAPHPWNIVIRVQARGGSESTRQGPQDIIIHPSQLIYLSQNNMITTYPLRKTGLRTNLTLWINPRSVLNRLEPSPPPMAAQPFQTQFTFSNRNFTYIVSPTVKHFITNPPQPFTVLWSEENDLRNICGPMPSFIIECFVAVSDTSQHDVAQRQMMAQSCLPVMCNRPGEDVRYNEMFSNENSAQQY